MASLGGQDSSPLDVGVQSYSLNAAEAQLLIFKRDELWKTFGPQTLQAACEFVRRVAEMKAKNSYTVKEAVQ